VCCYVLLTCCYVLLTCCYRSMIRRRRGTHRLRMTITFLILLAPLTPPTGIFFNFNFYVVSFFPRLSQLAQASMCSRSVYNVFSIYAECVLSLNRMGFL
jgi:hypothetical protein